MYIFPFYRCIAFSDALDWKMISIFLFLSLLLLNRLDADPEFFFKMKLDEEAKGLTNRPLILYTRINMGGANVKWLKNGQNVAVS